MNVEIFKKYDGRISVDMDTLIVTMWNRFIEDNGYVKIFKNDEEFFKNTFENPFDAAYAVSVGNYRWTDEFVYIDTEGHLMSFSRLDDDTCPIDLDRIDISSLIQELQELQELQDPENKKGYVENNISSAIHDALE